MIKPQATEVTAEILQLSPKGNHLLLTAYMLEKDVPEHIEFQGVVWSRRLDVIGSTHMGNDGRLHPLDTGLFFFVKAPTTSSGKAYEVKEVRRYIKPVKIMAGSSVG